MSYRLDTGDFSKVKDWYVKSFKHLVDTHDIYYSGAEEYEKHFGVKLIMERDVDGFKYAKYVEFRSEEEATMFLLRWL